MLLIRRVAGRSMAPTLGHQQLVLAVRTRRIQTGDVVIVRHNNLEKIKRVHRIEGGRVFVQGDNPAASTDSRHFGWLDQQQVIARLIWPRI